MFKWILSHGCNCCPIPDGCEKYFLNVGDVWGGIVESKKDENSGKIYWESWYTVLDKKTSGMLGGEGGRDYHMEWIENRITEACQSVRSILESPGRKIVDGTIQVDEHGEWYQDVLE